MNWEANERLWNSLLAVHNWLIKDFIDKVNNATEITRDDWQPLFAAHQVVKEQQFRLDSEVFRLSREAIEDSLYKNLKEFVETVNRQIQARDSGDRPLQETLLGQMGVQYNELVKDFEQQLHVIKTVLEKIQRDSPRIDLPSLRHVGGGIMINSPHSDQENKVINVAEGAVVTAPATITDLPTGQEGNKASVPAHRNPWISGSFYLASILVIGALFLVTAQVVSAFVLPVVLIASILAVSIVGALQLRNDDRLKEKTFLELMALTFRYLPLLRKRENSKQASNNANTIKQPGSEKAKKGRS